jgi:flagellar motor switch protein FliN/FliY
MISSTERFNDVPLAVEAQLECCTLTVEELLGLGPGSVIKTPRAAGDSVNLRVGNRVIALGEIIVIDNSLAIRISEFVERN